METQTSGSSSNLDPLRMTIREAAVATARAEIASREARLSKIAEERAVPQAEIDRLARAIAPHQEKVRESKAEKDLLVEEIRILSKIVDSGGKRVRRLPPMNSGLPWLSSQSLKSRESVVLAARDAIAVRRTRRAVVEDEYRSADAEWDRLSREQDPFCAAIKPLDEEVRRLSQEITRYKDIVHSRGKLTYEQTGSSGGSCMG